MLKIKGEHTDQSAKSKTLNYSNPAFDRERLERGYSFPFTLPHTPKNLRLLENKTRFDAKERTIAESSFDIGLQLSELKGVTFINQVGSNSSSVNFRTQTLDLALKSEKIKIRELLPTITIPINTWRYIFDIDLITGGFPAMTVNDVFIQWTGATPSPANAADIANFFVQEINQVVSGIASGHPTPERFIVSGTQDIDLRIADLNLINHTLDNPISTEIYAKFKTYFEGLMATPSDSHAFPMYYSPNFYGENNPAFKNFVNSAKSVSGVNTLSENTAYTSTTEKNAENTAVPMVRVKYLLDLIATSVGLDGIAGDFDNESEWNQLLIFNNLSLDNFRPDLLTNDNQVSIRNSFSSVFELGPHVPDITARQFLNIIASMGFCITVKNNRLVINKLSDYLDSVPHDISNQASPTVTQNIPEFKGYTIRYAEDSKESFSTPSLFENYVIGAGEQDETLPFRPLPESEYYNEQIGTFVRVCATSRLGSSPAFDINDEYPFCFLFERGLQPGLNTSITYIQSSTFAEDQSGNSIGDYTLALSGSNGILEKLLLRYYQLIGSEEITVRAVMPPADVLALMLFEKVKLRVYHPNGVIFFILKSISAQTGRTRMRVTLTGHRL